MQLRISASTVFENQVHDLLSFSQKKSDTITTKVVTDLDCFAIIYFAAMKEKKALAFRLKSEEVPR